MAPAPEDRPGNNPGDENPGNGPDRPSPPSPPDKKPVKDPERKKKTDDNIKMLKGERRRTYTEIRSAICHMKDLMVAAFINNEQEALDQFNQLHRMVLLNQENRDLIDDFMQPLRKIRPIKRPEDTERVHAALKNVNIPSEEDIRNRRTQQRAALRAQVKVKEKTDQERQAQEQRKIPVSLEELSKILEAERQANKKK